MSPKATNRKVLTAKKRRKGFSQMILETTVKEYEACKKLGKNTCVLIKSKNEYKFLILANNLPEFANHGNFFSIALGSSNSELGEAKDLLSNIRGTISEAYDLKDFHSTVALYFLARYLKGNIEEFWSTRGLSVEFMLFDPLFAVLHAIRLNGDYESFDFKDADNFYVAIGCYNKNLKRRLNKELTKCFKNGDISDKRLQKIGEKICKDYGLRLSGIIKSAVVGTSAKDQGDKTDSESSGTSPLPDDSPKDPENDQSPKT